MQTTDSWKRDNPTPVYRRNSLPWSLFLKAKVRPIFAVIVTTFTRVGIGPNNYHPPLLGILADDFALVFGGVLLVFCGHTDVFRRPIRFGLGLMR